MDYFDLRSNLEDDESEVGTKVSEILSMYNSW